MCCFMYHPKQHILPVSKHWKAFHHLKRAVLENQTNRKKIQSGGESSKKLMCTYESKASTKQIIVLCVFVMKQETTKLLLAYNYVFLLEERLV